MFAKCGRFHASYRIELGLNFDALIVRQDRASGSCVRIVRQWRNQVVAIMRELLSEKFRED